ncbi:MAG: PA2778 family cysteine peptidase [Pseudomonadota bacterium]
MPLLAQLRWWFAAAILLLNACTINPPLSIADVVGYPDLVYVPDVPFYPQEAYQCGPAALAGVLGATGVEIAPADLTPQVYLPERSGSLQLELLAASRRAGRIPFVTGDSVETLFSQLRSGWPVLVLQNLQTRGVPLWHYAVVVGYDGFANVVILNSGSQRELSMSAPSFLRTWEWAGRWGMVVLPPGEIPEDMTATDYLQAVAAFQDVAGGQASIPAWEAARQRWPNDARPYLALGNLAYDGGDYESAVANFRRGLHLSPDNPGLSNNLASVLAEIGCPVSAMAVLRPVHAALEEGSRWQPVIEATLSELSAEASADESSCSSAIPQL